MATPTIPVKPSPGPAIERIESICVCRRLPDLVKKHAEMMGAAAHAVRLELVDEAIARADADMFVSYRANGGQAFPMATYELSDAGHFGTYPDPDVSRGGLKKYGGATYLGYAEVATYFLSVNVDPKPLPDRSPGLVWDIEFSHGTASVMFVSLDGESYGIGLDREALPLDPRVGPSARWPAPVPGPGFGRIAFSTGRRVETTPLEPADKAFLKCAEQAWARARKRMTQEQIDADPEAQAREIRGACGRQIAAWERTFSENIDASVKARTALFEKAKARVASLGLDR